jgi:choline dehydrogenase-like flavoprotein
VVERPAPTAAEKDVCVGSTPPDRRQVQTLFEGVNRLRHKLDGMLSHMGMEHHHLLDRSLYMHRSMPIGATAHQAGTVRFGTDPASSALDVHCRAHDVDNLYVVDTSFFPSIGAVNPSLTAIANALRVGDHITERLR